MKTRPKSRTDNVVVEEMEGEVLVYDLDSNKAVCLNETAAIVWKLCDGKRTTSEIAEEASKKLRKPVTDELIWVAIDQLKAENLLSNGDAFRTSFNGLTRREVVRKVGIASMVALPLVSSIVAPQAVSAQSGCIPDFAPCSTPTCCNPALSCGGSFQFCCVPDFSPCTAPSQCCAGVCEIPGRSVCI